MQWSIWMAYGFAGWMVWSIGMLEEQVALGERNCQVIYHAAVCWPISVINRTWIKWDTMQPFFPRWRCWALTGEPADIPLMVCGMFVSFDVDILWHIRFLVCLKDTTPCKAARTCLQWASGGGGYHGNSHILPPSHCQPYSVWRQQDISHFFCTQTSPWPSGSELLHIAPWPWYESGFSQTCQIWIRYATLKLGPIFITLFVPSKNYKTSCCKNATNTMYYNCF